MYYIKIPLRHLCEPHELNVPEETRDAQWQERVESLLGDLRQGVIPAWSVDYRDLRNLVLWREDEAPALKG
jgi:hypothetical protein